MTLRPSGSNGGEPNPVSPDTPEPTYPIAQGRSAERELAPAPAIDRTPIIIGQGLSLQYISAVFRTCLVGYRQQYVDLLDELLEKDGHLYSVLARRVLAVASGKLEFPSAETDNDEDEALAQEIADHCRREIEGIPDRVTHFAHLAWSSYYAITACEKHWTKDGKGWHVERLSDINSRRLSYPEPMRWDLYVWDQGAVLSYFGLSPTNGIVGGNYGYESPTSAPMFGLRIGDYPNKFVVAASALRGDYPTREGLGRQCAVWVALKLIASRGASQYLERFAKPWPEVTYNTDQDGKPRKASKEDIALAETAVGTLGVGSLASWVHPDTLKLDLRTPDAGSTSKVTYKEWIDHCNAEHSKIVLGGTLTTEVGHGGGNRALGSTQKQAELVLEDYDALCLAETVRRDLVLSLVRLNYPGKEHLAPRVKIHVAAMPDPDQIIERAVKLANANAPVDADAVAEEAGVPLLGKGEDGRRLIPAKMVDPLAIDEDLVAARDRISPPEPVQETPPELEPLNDDEKDAPEEAAVN